VAEQDSSNELLLTVFLLVLLVLAVIFLANLIGALHVFG